METYDIYRDIAQRCGGDIYIGVVGPVRTGKSTLIARLMELMVLPNMPESHKKGRTVDELPQSGSGKTIMTTQPRFVPSEAATISLPESGEVNVRFVDCVGYMVRGALGAGEEEGAPRMVRTPWSDTEMPFAQAAELGTRKVIQEHSNVGVLVTTDGSVADLPRTNYIQAEERVVQALKATGKPFVMVLNSAQPDAEATVALQKDLSELYGVPVLRMDVLNMDETQMETLLSTLLYEFPLKAVHISLPDWMYAMDQDGELMSALFAAARSSGKGLSHMRDARGFLNGFDLPETDGLALQGMALGQGEVETALSVPRSLFYRVLGEKCGTAIHGDKHLMSLMGDLVTAKKEYDRIADALDSVRSTGYGLVPPLQEELTLEEPELVHQNGHYGVKLRASGPSLHLMRVDIATEVSPIMSTERESQELVKTILADFESDPQSIWKTNMFGKSLSELVEDGLSNKLMRMPVDVRDKMQGTLGKIVNEGGGGIICILL